MGVKPAAEPVHGWPKVATPTSVMVLLGRRRSEVPHLQIVPETPKVPISTPAFFLKAHSSPDELKDRPTAQATPSCALDHHPPGHGNTGSPRPAFCPAFLHTQWTPELQRKTNSTRGGRRQRPPADTKWPTAPAGSLRGLRELSLARRPALLREGPPGAPQQLTATGQSNPGPR